MGANVYRLVQSQVAGCRLLGSVTINETRGEEMNSRSDALALVGRVLLGVIFVLSGFQKLMGFSGTISAIAGKGLPMPEVLAAATVAIELGAGLLLLLGLKARWAAALLFLFIIPVSLTFHNFWTMEGAAAAMNKIQFMKNLSIMGGMLMVAAFGPGRYSIDKG
jgi:putative oxidoreductase